MPVFEYQATLASGLTSNGVITAANRLVAIDSIRAKDLTPVSLRELKPKSSSLRQIPKAQLLNVYTGLADLLESGVPLLKSIELVSSQTQNERLKEALTALRDEVADGKSIASAMRHHPNVFGSLEIGLVSVGEEGGFLHQSFARVAEMKERQEQLRTRMLNAMTYPCFLLLMGMVVGIGMFWFFVPIFEPMFERMRDQGELPWVTSFVLASSVWTKSWGIVIAVAIAVSVYGLLQWTRSHQGAQQWDRWKLSCRGVGPIVRDLTLAQFFHLLGMLLSNGVPILRALDLAAHSLSNRYLKRLIRDGHNNVMEGGTLATAISTCSVIPSDVAAAVAIAEQSNRLETVLLSLSQRLEGRAYKKLDVLTRLLEPVLMTIMAGMIGLLIIALLLPIITSAGRF